MIKKNSSAVNLQTVTMQGAENVQMQLLCGPDDGCPNFAMRRFVVAPGGCTPKHQHDYEHEVLVLAGEGVVFGDGREQVLKAGDAIYVPANELHQFRNTSSGPLEFILSGTGVCASAGAPVPKAVDFAQMMSQESLHNSAEGSAAGQPVLRVKPATMTALLHEEIPLTKAMGMTVSAWDGRTATLTAPLELNHNHADTAFGGAISTMGIMAGYCLIYMLLEERQISNRMLIQKSSVDYLRPIDSDLMAVACVPEEPVLGEFLQTLQKRRRARLTLESRVLSNGLLAASHSGLYVAMLY